MKRWSSGGIPWQPMIVMAILVLSVYGQVGNHGYVNFDDGIYVSENPVVLRGLTPEGVSWAFTTFHAGNWHPLTWLSHMLDVEIFGPSAGWHHRMNVLYHLLNTEFLFLVLWRMTGGLWQSAFAAALFGVHPLHVESVAWVAERKDVLSTLFWIITAGAYLRYVRRPGPGRYLALAAAFVLGLMCKPMLVTLPFTLLLLDFWPLGRFASSGSPSPRSRPLPVAAPSRPVREKIPLLMLSAASCAITYMAQAKGGAVASFERVPFVPRIANAIVSYVVYLGKTAWPSPLAVFYPHPATIRTEAPAIAVAGAILLLCGLSVVALRQAGRRPYLAAGWLWYLGTLIPVIGLVQVGAHAHADRYTYVPLIGIFIAVAWGVPAVFPGERFRRIALAAFAGATLLAFSAAARVQTGYWRDSPTLLLRAVAVTDGNWPALNNLGVYYNQSGQYPQAIGYLREALRIRPDYAEAWNNLGVSCDRLGQYRQAMDYYREALRYRPGYAEAWNNLGVSQDRLGEHRQAADSYREALRIAPDYARAWNNLGVSHDRLGEHREAADSYREALRIDPAYAEAWYNLGAISKRLGRREEAVGHFREAVRIAPDLARAWFDLGAVHADLGRHREAVGHYREALRVKPDYAEAWNDLGVSLAALGQHREAAGCFREALRISPDHAEARNNLAAIGRMP